MLPLDSLTTTLYESGAAYRREIHKARACMCQRLWKTEANYKKGIVLMFSFYCPSTRPPTHTHTQLLFFQELLKFCLTHIPEANGQEMKIG